MYVALVVRAIAATAVLRTAWQCDCNPSLYVTDLWFRYGSLLQQQARKGGMPLQAPLPPPHPFHNQCIWIIGASSGIGEELAYQLVSPIPLPSHHRNVSPPSVPSTPHHHHPIHLILSSRSIDRLQTVAATCQSHNRNCTITVLPFDVTNDDDIHSAIQELHQLRATTTMTNNHDTTVGLIDTVVFNAGIGHLSPAMETSPTVIDQIWKQTARYPMIIIPLLRSSAVVRQKSPDDASKQNSNLNNQSTASLMKQINRPHFVITSSIAAMIPVPLSAAYGAAKAALWNYGRTLQCEDPNLLLHTIMPGPVDTNFHRPTTARLQGTPPPSQLPPSLPKSTMKMSVHRCVQLMISTMRLSYSTESWMVPSLSTTKSPLISVFLLVGLYLNKFLPFAWLQSMIYSKIGPKRIRMWRNGDDLYDSKSWNK